MYTVQLPVCIRCSACKEYHQPYSTSYMRCYSIGSLPIHSRKARFQLEMFQGLRLTWNPTSMVIWAWNGIKSARSADLLDLSQNSDGKGQTAVFQANKSKSSVQCSLCNDWTYLYSLQICVCECSVRLDLVDIGNSVAEYFMHRNWFRYTQSFTNRNAY